MRWFTDLRGERYPYLQAGFNRYSPEEWCFFLSKRFRVYLRLAKPPTRRRVIFEVAWGWQGEVPGTVSGAFIHRILLEWPKVKLHATDAS